MFNTFHNEIKFQFQVIWKMFCKYCTRQLDFTKNFHSAHIYITKNAPGTHLHYFCPIFSGLEILHITTNLVLGIVT